MRQIVSLVQDLASYLQKHEKQVEVLPNMVIQKIMFARIVVRTVLHAQTPLLVLNVIQGKSFRKVYAKTLVIKTSFFLGLTVNSAQLGEKHEVLLPLTVHPAVVVST